MNIQEFKSKVVSVLTNKFEKNGNIEPVFLYVSPVGELKAVGMNKFVDNSREYVALFLKEFTKKEKANLTAYINNSTLTEMSENELKQFVELGDIYVPDNSNVTNILSVEINSKKERISLNFKNVGSDEKPKLQLINEFSMTNSKSIANLI
jgi:hypothetical protein